MVALVTGTSCHRVERPDPPKVIATKGGIEMVLIPAGTFTMGSDDGDADESPPHEVQLDAFLMDRYEMTQAQCDRLAEGSQWLAVNSSNFKGPDLPAELVRWDMAALFCNQRSLDEGLEPCYDMEGNCNFEADGYRLPTEAEWEYACRAGSNTRYGFGDDPGSLSQYAWHSGNASKKTHPVGQKKPNAWGLFDMHGNVTEWCNDVYAEDYYTASSADGTVTNPRGPGDGRKVDFDDWRGVLRGGHWRVDAEACGSATRLDEEPGFSDACFASEAIGFRCVRRATAEELSDDGT